MRAQERKVLDVGGYKNETTQSQNQRKGWMPNMLEREQEFEGWC